MASAFEKRDFKRGDRLSRRLRLVEQQIEDLYGRLYKSYCQLYKKTPQQICCGVFGFGPSCSVYFSRSLRGIERASRSILPGLNPTLRRAGT